MRTLTPIVIALMICLSAAVEKPVEKPAERPFVALFPDEGAPKGWLVRAWNNVNLKGPEGAQWVVKDGILHGSEPRGTWLVSEKLYGDFVLEFEFQLGERGNSGVGLRFPDEGDPAFDGLELQMVDPRYYPPEQKVGPDELTGSLYKAVAPAMQVYKPGQWNTYHISCIGTKVTVDLNGERIQDVNLDEQTKKLDRGDPLKDRPGRGHIGFQELSRGGGHVMIRKARIQVLDK